MTSTCKGALRVRLVEAVPDWAVVDADSERNGYDYGWLTTSHGQRPLLSICAPLSDDGEVNLRQLFRGVIPDEAINALRAFNGFRSYHDVIGMYGYRDQVSRNPAHIEPFPLNIALPNASQWSKGLDRDCMVLAYYSTDHGGYVAIAPDGHAFSFVRDRPLMVVERWPSFGDFVSIEVRKILKRFDRHGDLELVHQFIAKKFDRC